MGKKDKSYYVDYVVKDLKRLIAKYIEKEKFEKALGAIESVAKILYEFNQVYTDFEVEQDLMNISSKFKSRYRECLQGYSKDNKVILFYDGFGLDIRGVAKMYLNALIKNGYRVIYVIPKCSQGKMPETEKVTADCDVIWETIDEKACYERRIETFIGIVLKYNPKAMFYYTTPWDSVGYEGFAVFENLIPRYLIDLTDHAFWLGVGCNDFFCGSREMSASNQFYGRGIKKEKCIKLGVNLVVDEVNDHSGLPFDVKKTRYVFSGGALYKTLGDKNLYFYKIIDYIVKNNPDVKFLYAGSGDTKEMDRLMELYPSQVYLLPERPDFYYLIENSVFYLNTYPMFGGMMMKFSANAGKIPVTLKHNNDSDGLLLNQKEAKIEYNTYDDLVNDINRLLTDELYLKKRETLLENTIITERRFVNNIHSLIEYQRTDYFHSFDCIDTKNFREEFYSRFNLDTLVTKTTFLVVISNLVLYPLLVKKLVRKIGLIK